MKTGIAEIEQPPWLGSEPRLRHEPPPGRFWEVASTVWRGKTTVITGFTILAILAHLVLRFGLHTPPTAYQIPLWATLALGGIPLVYELLEKFLRREFGSDLLAGISIVTAVLLGEYLVGSIVVLMLAGGLGDVLVIRWTERCSKAME